MKPNRFSLSLSLMVLIAAFFLSACKHRLCEGAPAIRAQASCGYVKDTIDSIISAPSNVSIDVSDQTGYITITINGTCANVIPRGVNRMWYVYQDTTKKPTKIHFVDAPVNKDIAYSDSNAFAINRNKHGFAFKLATVDPMGSYIGIGEGDLRNNITCTHEEFNINNWSAANINNYIVVNAYEPNEIYMVIEQSKEKRTPYRKLTSSCNGQLPDSVCISPCQ